MTDVPLSDDELAAFTGNVRGGLELVPAQILRLVATVEQVRRERDEALQRAEEAEAVLSVINEDVVITIPPHSSKRYRLVPAEVDAIRAARATPGTETGEET